MIILIIIIIRNNITQIKTQLIENFKFKNEVYYLSGLICCPYNGHYIAFVINLDNEFKNLKKHVAIFMMTAPNFIL